MERVLCVFPGGGLCLGYLGPPIQTEPQALPPAPPFIPWALATGSLDDTKGTLKMRLNSSPKGWGCGSPLPGRSCYLTPPTFHPNFRPWVMGRQVVLAVMCKCVRQ